LRKKVLSVSLFGNRERLAELAGESAGITAIRESILQLLAAARPGQRLPSLLLLGETGTGKGLRAIHRAGPRAGDPFMSVNCAAVAETLFESSCSV
jgi:transcriptional regulator with PAS, ATPase and Fis domain